MFDLKKYLKSNVLYEEMSSKEEDDKEEDLISSTKVMKTEFWTDSIAFWNKDFKNYYLPLKSSIKVTPRDEYGDLVISINVKEISSGNITKFWFNDGLTEVTYDDYTFKSDFSEQLNYHLTSLFLDIMYEYDGI
tara:strand:+ start:81 stop:482 length:402 start_codon:yes stop_codon:yes gene_type:complete